MEKNDILCIHYYYPPIRSGGVLRNYYFSREFAKFFNKVHVVTTGNVDIMDQEPMDIPDNVIIYKAKTTDFRSIRKSKNHISTDLKKSKIFDIAIKLKKTLPFHFYIGEGGPTYIKTAVKIGRRLVEEFPITHMYSSFMPYADHLIASQIRRKFTHIKWIADFRDLQVEPIYDNIYFTEWNKKQERKILEQASLVTTISEGLAKSMDYLERNVLSIPRGIELLAEATEKPTAFTISYTGNLFQDYRDGTFLIKVLAKLIRAKKLTPENLTFIYAGRDSSIWEGWFDEAGLSTFFEDKGYVSREMAREIQQKSHALLLLSSSAKNHTGVLTGKLFEYLETKNPIINIIKGVRDQEFETLFSTLEAGKIFYPGDEDLLFTTMEEMYDAFTKNDIPQISNEAVENRQKLSWESRVKTILDAC